MRTAFIFPGQGVQYFGMGKDFYDNFSVSKEIFDRASDTLHMDMKKLCFEENEKLNITEYTQAAILTTCVAMYEVLKEREMRAEVAAGLSLGEYAALYACGAYAWEDAVTCIRQRGLYMQEAVPLGQGAMSAVMGLDAGVIESICEKVEGAVSIANYNCPGQIVITGNSRAVEDAGKEIMKAGAMRVVPLNVSGPFHSPMLKSAGEKLGKKLDEISWKELKIPYVANVNAEYIERIEDVKPLLIQQVSSSVMWQQSVEKMIQNGVERFVEIGPGKTLRKFVKKISKVVVVENVEKIEDLEKLKGN